VIVYDLTRKSGTFMLVVGAEVFMASFLLQACLQTLCLVLVFARCVVWSWDSIVSIVTRLWAGISVARDISLLRGIKMSSGVHPAPCTVGTSGA
jgi:hypothetical protein